MIKVKKKKFGPIWGFELGYSLINQPIKTVHIYSVDGIWIDSGQSKARTVIPKLVKATNPHSVYLTHYHEDHSGNAKYLMDRFHLNVYAGKDTSQILQKGFKILPYENLMFGNADACDTLLLGDSFQSSQYRFDVIPTPGHSRDHLSFIEKNEGWLFSGDAFVAEKIKYFRREENIYEQIISLKKIMEYDFDMLLCAHFPRKTKGKDAVRKKLEYFSNVYTEVAHWWSQGKDSAEIMHKLKIKEKTFIKWATFQDVSAEHLIKSAIASIKRGKKID